MQRIYGSPEAKRGDRRKSMSAEDREEEDDLGSCSSSSIGRNSDVSGESSSDGEDSTEAEVQSQLKGPLDTMESLEDDLPIRGISKFYNGKSKSFTSLADAAIASSVKEFAKPDNFYNKKRKNLLVHSYLLDKNLNDRLRDSGNELSKRVADSNGSRVALGTTMSGSPSSSLPPLHPQCKNSTMIGSSSITAPQPNLNPPCRSFSLSDLQFAAAVAGATSNIAGFAVHSGNKDS